MEFHEKLQMLRKRKGLTQEELAQALYVSRAAVSKWESGRGLPGIDSLKAIASYFSVSVDELLSPEAIGAQEDAEKKKPRLELAFGLADCAMLVLLFLPLFGERGEHAVRAVPLILLGGVSPYIKALCFAAILGAVLIGVCTLALQNSESVIWSRCKRPLSVGWGVAATVVFTVTLQVYAALLSFAFLAVKVFLAGKSR